MLENNAGFEEVLFRGKKLLANVVEQVSDITVEMGTGQITELAFSVEDPGFEILKTGVFDLNTKVTYKGLQLIVSVIETAEGGGLGQINVRCRPAIVNKLKKRRGKLIMNNVSPSTFLASEVKKAGGSAVIQPSPNRKQISRDVPQKGESYDPQSYPSTWTTMQRLADEMGYLMFEVGGVIYFGKPTWLVARKTKVNVQWYPENGKEPYSIPSFRQSVDNEDVELSLELPIEKAGSIFPGYGIVINGFPKYSGTYFINNVTYPLVGPGTVSVSASTVKNPKPQKAGDESGTSSSKSKSKKSKDDKWGGNITSATSGGGFL